MKFETSIYLPLLVILIISSCTGKPKIKFNETAYNFGDVKQNTEIKHIFIFKNEGNSTLVIDKIKAGWGCTGVLLSSKDIPAGGEGQIEVSLKIGKRKGKIRKTVYVYSNDEDDKRVLLSIEAIVSSEWFL